MISEKISLLMRFFLLSDAEYFLPGTTPQYMYLETIQEETSDDLRSDSDGESRYSPVCWLRTDSEDGSVICNERFGEFCFGVV